MNLQHVKNIPASRCLNIAFSPDGTRIALVTRTNIEWHPVGIEGVAQRFANVLPDKSELFGPIAIRQDNQVIAAVNGKGDPILLEARGGEGDLHLICSLTRFAVRPIRNLAFAGRSGEILLAATEDGYVQSWRLDELARELADLGLKWTAAEFPKSERPPAKFVNALLASRDQSP